MKSKRILLTLSMLALLSGCVGENYPLPTLPNQVYQVSDSDIIKERCQEAVDVIFLNIDPDAVVADFLLPISGKYQTQFTWTSSNTDVLDIVSIQSDSGKRIRDRAKVTPADKDTKVILTLRATISDHEADYAMRQFTLTVLKKTDIVEEQVPLEIREDFSSYSTGLDLGDYYSYRQSGSEAFLSTIVDGTDSNLRNVNDLVSSKALRITSQRLSSDTRYLRKANINSTNASSGALLEGYILFTGETNGVNFELLSGSNIVAGVSFSSQAISQYCSKEYQAVDTSTYVKEGVWIKFKLNFRVSSYAMLSIYDYKTDSYVNLTSSLPGYFPNVGVSSGNKGDIDGFRIVDQKGNRKGYTYVSDLHIGLSEDTVSNPNRNDGIGLIDHYEKAVFATEDSLSNLDSIDASTFVVHNRFNEDETYSSDEYMVSTSKKDVSSSIIEYTHTYHLLSTGEVKTITQTVYLYKATDKPSLVSFKASAIKVDSSDSTKSKGNITISGTVNRNDATLYYVIVNHGVTAPTASQILSPSTLSGCLDRGSLEVKDRSFSITSATLALNGNYDVYAVLNNSVGTSSVASSLDLSTVINITSCLDFYQMASDVTTSSSSFRLLQDLDFADFYWDCQSEDFEFHGTLDGQGYTVKNLTISSSAVRVGIFSYCYGTVKNIHFENCSVFGSGNTGVIAGNVYGGNYEDLSFNNCEASIEATCTGGEGYFGILSGRCRGEGKNTVFKNISITSASIECPKYCGLLTGGLEKGVVTTMDNITASGNVDTDGAAVGLIGRNRGDTTINDLICFLTITYAKKEFGAVAGHNKEGGKLVVSNAILDVKVKGVTQAGYFASFIGSHDAATSSYSATNVAYIDEDYSDLGDFTKDVKCVDAGRRIPAPSSKREWEENTFLRDFDTNLVFRYDEKENLPVLSLRKESDLVFTHTDFEGYVSQLDMTHFEKNHYYLVKSSEILSHLSDSEKSLVSKDSMTNYNLALEKYNSLVSDIDDIIFDIGWER